MQEFLMGKSDTKKDSKSHTSAATHYQMEKVGPFSLDRIYVENCISAMKKLPTNSVDIAIADPPYNLSKGGIWKWDNSVRLPGFGGDWSKVMAEWDNMPLAEYFSFTLAWLSELKRIVRPTGSLWVHGTYHNIGIINFALQLLEAEIINEIVWYKRNSFPNLSGRRLTASHETILWAHTGSAKQRKYFFAYDRSKEMNCPEDYLKEQGKQMRTVWNIPNNKKREEIRFGKHPTQKPIRLLSRMIELSAKAGDILLIPFAGAGSDCVAAKQLGIRFLAFESDEYYAEICKKRIDAVEAPPHLVSLSTECPKEDNISHSGNLNRARSAKTVPSIIKWTGSKRSQAVTIAKLLPPYQRYIEPFLGGGALLYLTAVPGSVVGDLYEPLIQLWRLIQAEPDMVIKDYEKKWTLLKDELDGLSVKEKQRGDGIPKLFYAVRERFNQEENPLDLNFLMRTCVNGIVRFNEDGEFNNSFHLSRRGMEPGRFKSIVESWHAVIKDIVFVCQDYMNTIEMAEKDDFIYLDPPYAGNQQRYIAGLDLERFFAALDELNKRGVKWALSFDGKRGTNDLIHAVPSMLFKRHLLLESGNSAVNKVLNGPIEKVQESLYLNY